MPEAAPDGVFPMFLRGVTTEKYGFKTGEGVMDLVEYKLLSKEEIMNEIVGLGVMSDFECAKKQISSAPGEELLFVVDRDQKYGEVFLLCHTEETKDEFMNKMKEAEEAIEAQKRAEEEAEAARIAAEEARKNIVYEDKPIEPNPWNSETNDATIEEVDNLTCKPFRDNIKYVISRPKMYTNQPVKFMTRDASISGVAEFRSHKDPNFIPISEADTGIQCAPQFSDNTAQTTWYRTVNKAIQYEAISTGVDIESPAKKVEFLRFLEDALFQLETALQENESVDIFHETFSMVGDEDNAGEATDSDLREVKNFADPNYTKAKAIAAIDWVPKVQGMVAISPVRNITFDERAAVSGQTTSSHILIWDFRQLVRPQLIMQSPQEVLSFKFNRSSPNLVAGGCISGQVCLWDISKGMSKITSKTRSDEEEGDSIPQATPKFISHVDYSHKRPITDLFWLPANTQINYRGQLVAAEHLTDEQFQFVTVSGDGHVMVWDIRYEQIYNDELRHVGRSKLIPVEKTGGKNQGEAGIRILWSPIFNAHIKRAEGIGELSLNKVDCAGLLKKDILENSGLDGDARARLFMSTEEGDLLHVDLCAGLPEGGGHHDDDGEHKGEETGREFVKWIAPKEHTRPSVYVAHSPFFADIIVSVSDWNFHIWKVGIDKPIFVSPASSTYLTAASWSPTRPAVLLTARADGEIHIWDFTDSSYRASIELKATPNKITSMEFLSGSASSRHQLLAVGVDVGTLQIFELPRNVTRSVPNEEESMNAFINRELETMDYQKQYEVETEVDVDAMVLNKGGFDAMGLDEPDDAATDEIDPHKAKKEALMKEDEEFEKMELAFIEELGLQEVPDFAQKHLDALKSKDTDE